MNAWRPKFPYLFLFAAVFLISIVVIEKYGLFDNLSDSAIAFQRPSSAMRPLSVKTDKGVFVYTVEVADNSLSREIGLMNRPFMAADRGMIFKFDAEQVENFWMKDTYIPLDIIFMAHDGGVTRIAANAEPFSETIIPSGVPCFFVLELNGGASAKMDLKIGDKITLLP